MSCTKGEAQQVDGDCFRSVYGLTVWPRSVRTDVRRACVFASQPLAPRFRAASCPHGCRLRRDFAHHARRHALLELVAVTCPSSRTLCLRYAAVAVRFYGRVISGMFPLRNPCTVHPYLSWAGGLALSSCRWARGRGGVCVGAQLEGRVWKFRGFGGRSCAFCPHEYFAITYGCSYGCARFAHGSRQGAHHDGMPGNVTREPPH
jgi:hypothetical protein